MDSQEQASELEAHLGYWMRLVSNEVSGAFSRKLEEAGVSVTEWVLLRALLDLEEAAPSRLAEELNLTRGAISKVIEKLQNKRLVHRVTDESDRRCQHITLTREGEKLVPKLAQMADENEVYFFGHLTLAERTSFLEMLQSLAKQHRLKNPPLG